MLRNALETASGLNTFNVLAATTALYRYEQINFTTKDGWIHHAGGMSRIIQMSGPEAFRHFPNKAILDVNWYVIVLGAYV